MRHTGHAGRTDKNQADIVAALRSIGATVHSLGAVGDGVPDLLVGFRGETILLEVKDGRRPASARALSASEREFHASWRGGRLAIVTSVDEAVESLSRVWICGS